MPGYWRQHVHKEIQPELDRHHGRLVKTTGDGFLAEFASPVEAVRSVLAIQDQLAESINQAIRLRIGINLGDIIIEDDGDVIGDGVNVAARLEQIAEPGGVCLSGPSTSKWQGRLIVHLKIAVSSTSRTFLGLSGFMRSRGP